MEPHRTKESHQPHGYPVHPSFLYYQDRARLPFYSPAIVSSQSTSPNFTQNLSTHSQSRVNPQLHSSTTNFGYGAPAYSVPVHPLLSSRYVQPITGVTTVPLDANVTHNSNPSYPFFGISPRSSLPQNEQSQFPSRRVKKRRSSTDSKRRRRERQRDNKRHNDGSQLINNRVRPLSSVNNTSKPASADVQANGETSSSGNTGSITRNLLGNTSSWSKEETPTKFNSQDGYADIHGTFVPEKHNFGYRCSENTLPATEPRDYVNGGLPFVDHYTQIASPYQQYSNYLSYQTLYGPYSYPYNGYGHYAAYPNLAPFHSQNQAKTDSANVPRYRSENVPTTPTKEIKPARHKAKSYSRGSIATDSDSSSSSDTQNSDTTTTSSSSNSSQLHSRTSRSSSLSSDDSEEDHDEKKDESFKRFSKSKKRDNDDEVKRANSRRSFSRGRRCLVQGCDKLGQGKSCKCIAHGGGKRCQHEGCTKGASGSTNYCVKHGGGIRCSVKDCERKAQGPSGKCKAHGGGARCQVKGCGKSAQDSTPYCKAHGGGKRCTFVGCTKSARGNTRLCIAHGGGKQCSLDGCFKSTKSSTGLCGDHKQHENRDQAKS